MISWGKNNKEKIFFTYLFCVFFLSPFLSLIFPDQGRKTVRSCSFSISYDSISSPLLSGAILFLPKTEAFNSSSPFFPSFFKDSEDRFPVPKIPFAPPNYVCYRASSPLKIDGHLEETDWKRARWTEDFLDIEGESRPKPRFRTRAKMLWDDNYFYVAADLEEKDVWATLTERDSIIYLDNDFEVFIDPDGDSHEYYELEINAFGTVWDLLLIRPYRDGGPAVHAWDIRGLKAAVKVDGTINKPGDKDKGWTVELAFPWEVLKECIHPGKLKPDPGDQWRVNFSRVEYRVNVKDGRYEKAKDPSSGRLLAEDNWVWAPTGLINIHYPEMWGYVQFSEKIVGQGKEEFQLSFEQDASWALRQIYYRQKDFFARQRRYSENIEELGLAKLKVEKYRWPPEIKATWNGWEARLLSEDGRTILFIREDGRFWKSSLEGKETKEEEDKI